MNQPKQIEPELRAKSMSMSSLPISNIDSKHNEDHKNCVIYVGNLAERTTAEEIRMFFKGVTVD